MQVNFQIHDYHIDPKASYKKEMGIFTGLPYGKPSRKIDRFPFFFFTGLPMAIPVGKWVGFVCFIYFLFFFFFFFFRVGKSLARLCA